MALMINGLMRRDAGQDAEEEESKAAGDSLNVTSKLNLSEYFAQRAKGMAPASQVPRSVVWCGVVWCGVVWCHASAHSISELRPIAEWR